MEVDVKLPDDLDGPEDLCQFLLDEAPFAQVSAVRYEPIGEGAVPGPTGVPCGRPDENCGLLGGSARCAGCTS